MVEYVQTQIENRKERSMKWPASITMLRHGRSAYNALRAIKMKDELYLSFLKAYEEDYRSPECYALAKQVWEKFGLGTSDYGTPLDDVGVEQAFQTGRGMAQDARYPRPDVVLVSPHLRTRQTFEHAQRGGLRADGARIIIEDRIREQEHGLSVLYSDWRVFQVMHPEQKPFRDLMGPYWYQFPQGESASNVRDRTRDVNGMLIREFPGQHVYMITHHLTILSMRANFERLTPEQFIHLDEHETPINCGVTRYVCDPKQGSDGKLILSEYNTKHY